MSKEVGERLRRVRKTCDLSQRKMALAIGLSAFAWQKIENGDSIPSGQTLMKLAENGFNPTWVLTGLGSMRLEDGGAQGPTEPTLETPSNPLKGFSNMPLREEDEKLLGRVLEALSKVYKETGFSISMSSLGEMALAKTKEIVEANENSSDWPGAINLMALQIKKELLKPASDTARSKFLA